MGIFARSEALIIAAGIFLVAVFFAWAVYDSRKQAADSTGGADIVYYYGEGCSHCKELGVFLEENKVAEKVDFVKKEVWRNKGNNNELMKRAEECGLDKNKIGVPFVYSRGKCFVGGPDATKFFTEALGRAMQGNPDTEASGETGASGE
jgi:glutaredoxin